MVLANFIQKLARFLFAHRGEEFSRERECARVVPLREKPEQLAMVFNWERCAFGSPDDILSVSDALLVPTFDASRACARNHAVVVDCRAVRRHARSR